MENCLDINSDDFKLFNIKNDKNKLIEDYILNLPENIVKLFEQLNKETDISVCQHKLSKFSEIVLKNIYYLCNFSYYYLGKSLINDFVFDNISFIFDTETSQDESCFTSHYLKSVNLPYPMPSLIKYYDGNPKLYKQIQQCNNIVISSKLDGVSCLLIKKNNDYQLFTKGNGSQGRNITYLLEHINIDLKKITKSKIILRGELIIQKQYISHFQDKKNLRSQVIGLINRDPQHIEEYKHLLNKVDIVFYQVFKPENLTFLQQLQLIDSFNFNIKIQYQFYSTEPNFDFKKLYYSFLEKEIFDIDGLVIANNDIGQNLMKPIKNYNSFIFAYKLNTIFGITRVLNIIWSETKNMKLIPILILKPIVLANNTIKQINGFNAKSIITKKIGINSKVKIKYSGNIIPIIDEIIETSENIPMPLTIKWDKNQTHLLSNTINSEILSKQIEVYYNKYNISGFKAKTIKKVIDRLEFLNQNYINDIFSFIDNLKIYFNKESDFLLGKIRDKILLETITIFQTKIISISSLLVATNKFIGFNDVQIKKILSDGNILSIIQNNLKDDIKIEHLQEIKSIGPKLAQNFYTGIQYFLNNKELFEKYFVISYDNNETKPKISVVFSGIKTTENPYIEYYKDYFIQYLAITKNIDYLVVHNPDEIQTTKSQKACQYNIPIISLYDFIHKMKEIKHREAI